MLSRTCTSLLADSLRSAGRISGRRFSPSYFSEGEKRRPEMRLKRRPEMRLALRRLPGWALKKKILMQNNYHNDI